MAQNDGGAESKLTQDTKELARNKHSPNIAEISDLAVDQTRNQAAAGPKKSSSQVKSENENIMPQQIST